MARTPDQAYREAVHHAQAGRWREAAAILETWAPRHPLPALWSLLGAARHRLGDAQRASEAFRTSLELAPRQADTRHNLAVTLRDLGEYAAALEEIRRALALRPDYPAARRLLAELQDRLGDAAGAETTLRQHLQRHPEDHAAWNNLALLLEQRGEGAEAIACLERALALGEDADIHCNLGLAHLRQGRLTRARNHLQRALALAPDEPAVHNDLGLLAEQEGRYDQAQTHFEHALRLDPEHPRAHTNLARLLLGAGRLRQGWRHYLWRRSRRGRQYRTALPADLTAQTLHIDRDQGIGDELFFLRWIPLLRARGARIHYHGDARLNPLLLRAGVVDEASAESVDEALAWSVGDLPALLDSADHPPPVPLIPDPRRQAHLNERLATLPRPWIALTWEAGTPGPDRLHKRIEPALLGQALAAHPGSLLILQRHPKPQDLDALQQTTGRPLTDFSALHDDLEDLLALMSLADHYITVSNTALHLRAALGLPAHVLVPHPPEWRWGRKGQKSPWFPRAKVYRQEKSAGWDSALKKLISELNRPDW